MKIATKNTVAAALAVALASMGLPVAAFAANSAENAAGTETAAEVFSVDNNEDVIIVESYQHAQLSEINGKWFALTEKQAQVLEADTSVRYKIVVKNGIMDCFVGGSGAAGKCFPLPYCCADLDTGTFYVGAGITSIGTSTMQSTYAYQKKVVFEQGSQLKEIGSGAFALVESINLEDCEQLESIGAIAFEDSSASIIIPASVTELGYHALAGVDNITVLNPKTPVTVDVTGDPNTATYGTATIISKPSVKVVNPNKVTVSWSAPKVRTYKNGKMTDSKVTYSVKYKVQYRVIGTDVWTNTGYITGKSKTLTMLAKGQQYEVRVAAYKKNSKGKWVAATTSQKATTAAIKGYNPTPKLKAGTKSLTASWSKVKGATSYKVYYKKSSSKKWSTKTVGKSAKVKLTGLTSKKTYQVKVRAYKGSSGICESSVKTATTALEEEQAAPEQA